MSGDVDWRPLSDLPFAHGGPPLAGRLRTRAEDFRVDEVLGFEPDGEGGHCLLHLRKTGLNTEQVARELARHAGVPPRDVGFAGLKDRNAVTSQWFSVGLAGRPEPDWSALASDRLALLSVHRHRRKLRRGILKGNRFVIRIRELAGEREAAEAVLARLAADGVPNYFGEQRFGRDYGNLEQAGLLFAGRLKRVKPHLRGLYLSAARSQIFNEALALRVAQGTWNRALPGDLMQLDGTHSWFAAPEVDAEIERRLAEHDIHPTGPLWGAGEPPGGAGVAELERGVAGRFTPWCEGLAKFGMKQERRALRLFPQELTWEWQPDGALEIGFRLTAGSFATTVLRELLLESPGKDT